MSNETQVDVWDEIRPTEEISIKEMDDNLAHLRKLKDEYEEKSAESKMAYAKLKEQEAKVIDMLERSGKKKYVSDFGNATLVQELSVKTPKTPEQKRAFFEWVEKNLGEDARDVYMTVNSRTLNSFYKEQSQLAAERGEVLNIDGLEEPTSHTKLSFRKAK